MTNEAWDSNNNLISTMDPRGAETDYAYDANGNTIAVAQPTPTSGAFRPTSLYSYDAFNNVTAYCDPLATHSQLHADWTTSPLTSSDTLCPQSALAAQFIWSNPATGPAPQNPVPAYEPFGELQHIIKPGVPGTPSGYNTTLFYDPSHQGGVDYGLPSSTQGDAIAADGGRTPDQHLLLRSKWQRRMLR